MLKMAAVISALVGAMACAQDAGTVRRLSTELPINQFITGSQDHQVVAVTNEGIALVAWSDNGGSDGDHSGIAARFFNENGEPLSDEFIVNTTTRGNQLAPDVATNKTDRFVVVWPSGPTNSRCHIFGTVLSSSGEVIVPEFQISVQGSITQSWPDVSMLPNGDFVVIWDCIDSTGMDYYVHAYHADGTALFGPTKINQIPNSRPTDISIGNGLPDISINSSGFGVVVWEQHAENRSRIAGRSFRLYDRSVTNEVLLAELSADSTQRRPKVSVNDKGDIVVVWTETAITDRGHSQVYLKRKYGATGLWSSRIALGKTNVGTSQHRAVVELTADGKTVAAWTSFEGAASDQEIVLRIFNQSGYPETDFFKVNTTSFEKQTRPSFDWFLDVNGTLRLFCVWEGITDGDGLGVFGTVLSY